MLINNNNTISYTIYKNKTCFIASLKLNYIILLLMLTAQRDDVFWGMTTYQAGSPHIPTSKYKSLFMIKIKTPAVVNN